MTLEVHLAPASRTWLRQPEFSEKPAEKSVPYIEENTPTRRNRMLLTSSSCIRQGRRAGRIKSEHGTCPQENLQGSDMLENIQLPVRKLNAVDTIELVKKYCP
jgi:hypothetical protein